MPRGMRAGSAGASTSGTDYDSSALGSAAAPGTTNTDVDFVLSGDLSFFSTRASGGMTAGFLFKAADESLGGSSRTAFNSINQGTVSNRPELILDVTARVPEPSTCVLAALAAVGLIVSRRRQH